jgi:hypothetical protein
MAAFNENWEQQLKQKAAQEVVAKQVLKEAGERYLDTFHDEKTDMKVAKMVTISFFNGCLKTLRNEAPSNTALCGESTPDRILFSCLRLPRLSRFLDG